MFPQAKPSVFVYFADARVNWVLREEDNNDESEDENDEDENEDEERK